jgi:hypothetical protein
LLRKKPTKPFIGFELLVEAKIATEVQVAALIEETNEIVAMTVASIKTLRGRR